MGRRVWWWLALLGIAALLLTTGLPGQSPTVDSAPEPAGTYELEDGTVMWPYTSKTLDVAGRTLPINVVVTASPAETQTLLAGGSADWEPNEPAAHAETYAVGRWGAAAGADRFTAVFQADDSPVWLSEDSQLADGHYLGSREHVRVYGLENGRWSALQVHGEHWDWFRLRHTVDDLVMARNGVIDDLERGAAVTVEERDSPPRRVVIVAGALLVLAGRRRASRTATVAHWPAALYLAVRATGIAVEAAAPWAPPKAIVAVLYPFVVLGIPIAAYASMQRTTTGTGPRTAFVLAGGTFALALVLDGLAMGATAPTVRMLVYRSVAILAVGLLAAAGTENGPRSGIGLGVWAVAIVLPLGGLV